LAPISANLAVNATFLSSLSFSLYLLVCLVEFCLYSLATLVEVVPVPKSAKNTLPLFFIIAKPKKHGCGEYKCARKKK
jgi:hypothetical protein